MGLARMLLPGVRMGRTNTTGWRGPLVKARPWEVKGLDLVFNRSSVRRDGGPGGSNATGASYRALIHAGWCCGMSEKAARISGACPPPLTDGAAAGTWRGETNASGLHGWGLAVALARKLLQSVPIG